jgi:hypothetical protein
LLLAAARLALDQEPFGALAYADTGTAGWVGRSCESAMMRARLDAHQPVRASPGQASVPLAIAIGDAPSGGSRFASAAGAEPLILFEL